MRALTSAADPVLELKKMQRHEDKQAAVNERCENDARYECEWPQVVSREVVVKCLDDYRKFSQWTEPSVCAVCARY